MISRIRSYAGLLADRDFRRLWIAQSISQLGSQVTNLALPLVAIVVLGTSAFEVALLGAIEFLPFLLFTLPAGVWVDRLEKRRLLVVADLGRAAILATVPLAAMAGVLSIWLLYVVAFAAGTLTVLFDISYQAFVPELVERDRLPEGNSRLEISRSAAIVVGPGLGGVLIGVMSAPIAIVVDAISYLGSAGFLVGLRRRTSSTTARVTPGASPGRPSSVAARRGSLRSEMAEGLRYFVSQPLLRAASGSIVILNFGLQLSAAIMLVYAVRELGLTAESIGLALSIGSLGVLAGAATSGGFGRRFGIGPTLIIASAMSGLATAILVIASAGTAFWVLIASGVINGYAAMLITINGLSLRQAVTPDALQGRVNATGRWINWSVIPVGAILGGFFAGIIGLRATIGLSAAVISLAVPWLLLSPLRTQREMPRLAAAGSRHSVPEVPEEAIGLEGPVLHTPG